MPSHLKICQVGSPVLRQSARALSIDEIRSARIQHLIEQMRDTMHDAPGVGLAAPQIGETLQLVVIEDRADMLADVDPALLTERDRNPVPFQVIINPQLTITDTTPVTFFEGCLSVAGMHALVPRAAAVTVECLNERGDPVTIRARGWHARILQHEIDHLHGTLCTDIMEPRSLTTTDNYFRYWNYKNIDEIAEILDLQKT